MNKRPFDTKSENTNEAKKFPQYIAAMAACLGSLSSGTVLGWTANISEDLKQLTYKQIPLDDNVLGWIGSLAVLGATVACIPVGFFCNLVGRKGTMMYLTIPLVVGWLLIIFAQFLWMIYLGRFLTGFAGGGFAVAVPIYISEISDRSIRGALGSYYDLSVTLGILVASSFAIFFDLKSYTIVMGVLPLLFVLTFALQPDSYLYYIIKNKNKEARNALIRLRGKLYDIEEELESTKFIIMQNNHDNNNFMKAIKTKAAKKATFISCVMMMFLQLGGVNAMIFYTASIFESTGVKVDAKISTIVFALLQVLATVLSTFTVDKLGRRPLLIISNVGSAMSVGLLALFFTFESRKIVDDATLSYFKFVPLVSLSMYIIAFSIGMGPIPWFLAAELFPPAINSIGCAFAATICTCTAFLVTKFHFNLVTTLGSDVTFYFYSGSSILCVIFVYFFVPETKGKTLAEIQMHLNT